MNALIVLGVVLLVGAVIFLTLEDRICTELRGCHRELWEAIGSPERVFDDAGMARRNALAKLHNSPELLGECRLELVRMIKVRHVLGRIYLGLAGVALAVVMLDYFGII